MAVHFDISLERNEYAAGETAKGTLVISAGRGLQLRGLKFYVCGVEISSITEVKEYASQIAAIPRTYKESANFFYEDLSAFSSIASSSVKVEDEFVVAACEDADADGDGGSDDNNDIDG